MDMKLRGMYIARQLSFSGVSFRIDEVELPEKLRSVYNESVDLWVELMHKFEEASLLVEADKRVRKTMWGQFWSAHQRFFKYLCIASKVPHVVEVANEVQKMGKCVVIGLQSTGEARTIEVVEREEELTDFVSTSKGVLQSLVEKHFPAPDRGNITRVLGISSKNTLLDELGISTKNKNQVLSGKRGKRQAATTASKKVKIDMDEDEGDSDFIVSDEEEDDEFEVSEASEESDFNPFGSESDSDCDDPFERRGRKGKKPKKPKKDKANPFAHLAVGKIDQNGMRSAAPDTGRVERAIKMKEDLLRKIENLGSSLPANTLDELIDELGGPSLVSEMTGRKGRVVMDDKTGRKGRVVM